MLKKLAFGCLLVVALAVVGLYAAWRQVTRLPDWYSEATTSEPPAVGEPAPPADLAERSPGTGGEDGNPRTAPAATTDRRSGDLGGPNRRPLSVDELRRSSGRVELDERQLNELLIRSLDENRNGRRVRRAAKAVRASFHGDRLEVGIVTSLADLAAVAENGREAEVVRRLRRLVPWLKDRDFYLAARGKPGARNGHLFFDRDVELVVGGVGFNAVDTAARLGVPRAELDAGAELPIAGLYLEDVEIDGDSMVLSLSDR